MGTTFGLVRSSLDYDPGRAIGGNYANDDSTLTYQAAGTFELSIPGRNVDLSFAPSQVTQTTSTGATVSLAMGIGAYSLAGIWTYADAHNGVETLFISGFRTPTGNVPITGTATFNGSGQAVGIVHTINNGLFRVGQMVGDVMLTADFPNNKLTGLLSNFVLLDEKSNRSTWGTVSIAGSLNSGQITGTTAVATMPAGVFALSSSATGFFNGELYGPNGTEISALWSLSDGTNAVLGAVTAEGTPLASPAVVTPPNAVANFMDFPIFPPLSVASSAVIAAPAAAGAGSNATPRLTAYAGGPSLDGITSFEPANTAFPLTQTVMKLSAAGLSVDTAANSAGATLVISPSGGANSSYTNVLLELPTLGITNESIQATGQLGTVARGGVNGAIVTGSLTAGSEDFAVFGSSYVSGGIWEATVVTGQVEFGAFQLGYEAPITAVPSTGTGTYSGTGNVMGYVFVPGRLTVNPPVVTGDASLMAAFGTGHISGLFTNMRTYDRSNPLQSGFVYTSAWNDVTVAADIASGTSKFKGTATAGAPPASSQFALKAGASGSINGGLYGPNAEDIGAVWSVSNGDNTGSAVGVVIAANPAATAATTPLPQAETPPDAVNQFMTVQLLPAVSVTASPPTLAAPLTASAGQNSAPSQLALPGAPTLDGSSSFGATGTTFPLTESVVRISPSGLAPDTTATAGGGTITLSNPFPGNSTTVVDIDIPSLGMSASVQVSSLGKASSGGSTSAYNAFVGFMGLSYTSFGVWAAAKSDGSGPSDAGAFVFGFETPAAAVPASGTANYSGAGKVIGNVYLPGKISGTPPIVNGDVALTANFSTGQISGTLTNMRVYDHANASQPANVYSFPWNDVSVSASITSGTAKFGGSTTASSQPVSPYALKSTATGSIKGSFYGPNAENIGAVWTLSNGDGTGSALGVIGATKQ